MDFLSAGGDGLLGSVVRVGESRWPDWLRWLRKPAPHEVRRELDESWEVTYSSGPPYGEVIITPSAGKPPVSNEERPAGD
ncbi:hypothetical protein VSH64_00390 [Amycolatopsis rhabdoformis]|uniref:Uncharacterized protein n=1 Tax=Amycolatopsis rhabdoformis TaxID=1448059 RepID=A0ABZ1IAL6_9PSEU|nr:hypothetical protein [Amycolatopsis rhabdoformis]WSE30604.1 hypothetical protein VSH64_00390 [Amycolatopsis rhabdoformis]